MPEKVRWGVMSTANIGQIAVIPAIQKSKFGVVEALGSRDTEKAGRVAHALGISRVVDSYEALLKDPDIDAVYIPLPRSDARRVDHSCGRGGEVGAVRKAAGDII